MEKIYSEEKNACKPMKVGPEVLQFLLNYSKSLKIMDYESFKFETSLN